jgi:hypothetical protein
MKKSIVNLVNVLKEKLLEFPILVNKIEKKDLDFLNQYNIWLQKSEEILSSYNIRNVSELAGIRSKIIATKFNADKKIPTKKLQLKVAADSLFDAQNVLLNVIAPYEIKIEESKELIRQLLLIVSQANVIKYNKNAPLENLISEIWQFIISNEQLKPGAVKLRTTLQLTDIQLLIAEEINIEDF